MEARFQAVCEAAAVAWDVPALAVGTRLRATSSRRRRLQPRHTLWHRLDHEAVHGHARRPARSRSVFGRVAARMCRSASPLSYERVRGDSADLSRFGDGDDALPRPSPAAVVRRWSTSSGPGRTGTPATGSWARSAAAAGSTFEDALTARGRHAIGLETPGSTSLTSLGRGRGAIEGPYPRYRRPSGGLASTVGSRRSLRPASPRLEPTRRDAHLLGKPPQASTAWASAASASAGRGLGPSGLERRLPDILPRHPDRTRSSSG